MQIKKRYIKEEIERLEGRLSAYYALARAADDPYMIQIARTNGQVNALEWVLGFADD